MTDQGSPRVEPWCPSCFVTVGDAAVCPSCGLAGQDGPDAARLRFVVSRVHGIAAERAELQREFDDLAYERHQLFLRLRAATDATRVGTGAAPTAPRAEWRPERVRDVLLWLGALLLVIAAITFAAVAWTRLGPAGRAAILLGVTVGSGALTAFVRRRLRPTAEALGAITIALALVDWGVAGGTPLRGDWSGAAWWSVGLLAVALLCVAVAGRIDLTSVRLGATLLPPVAAVFALGAWSPERTVVVLTLAAISTGVVLLRAALRGRWSPARPALGALAIVGELAVVVGAVVGAVDDWAGPGRAGAALALLATAVAPLVALAVARKDETVDAAAVAGAATLALVGAALTLLSGTVSTPALLAGLAVVAVAGTAGARLLPSGARRGVVAASLLAAVVPAVATVPDVAAAWLRPVEWLGHPWTGSLDAPVAGHLGRTASVAVHDVGSTFVVFVGLAALALLLTAGRPRVERAFVPGVVATVGLSVGVAAANPTIAGALVVQLAAVTALVVAAVLADRRAQEPRTSAAGLILATVAAVPALGWAAVTPRASLMAVGTLVALGGFGAVAFRSPSLRAGSAAAGGGALLGGIAIALAERGVATAPAAFVIVAVGATMLLLARARAWPASVVPVALTVEAAGGVGAAVGLAVTGTAPTWRLLAYALATLTLVLAAHRDDERAPGYATAALIAGGLTGVAGIAHGRIPGEWVTIPAAIVATVIVLVGRFPVRRSWLRFGPALLMGFVTSVVLAVDHGDGWRVVLVLLAASGVVAIGARARLGAPIVVGSVALLVLAIDGAAPYAAALPRWLLIGTAGAFALWAGATADRRVEQVRRWRNAIDQLS